MRYNLTVNLKLEGQNPLVEMYKDYFLFCIVFGTFYMFIILPFVGFFFFIVSFLPYWILDNSSSKKINENRELNKGEKERRGIVRLRSDSLIDLRNSNAENIPKIIKTMPGIKYNEIFT